MHFFYFSWIDKTFSLLLALSAQLLVTGQIVSSKLTSPCGHLEDYHYSCVTPETLPDIIRSDVCNEPQSRIIQECRHLGLY